MLFLYKDYGVELLELGWSQKAEDALGGLWLGLIGGGQVSQPRKVPLPE